MATVGASIPFGAKFAYESFGPFTVLLLRFFFGSLVLLPFVHKAKQLSIQNFKVTFFAALIGAMNPTLLFIALTTTRASLPPMIYATVPILTAVYTWIFQANKLSNKQLLGIISGFIGVAIIVLLPVFGDNMSALQIGGNALIFLAALAFTIYGIKSKVLQNGLGITPMSMSFYAGFMNLLVAIPLAGGEMIIGGLPEGIELTHILSGVYLGIFGTGVFYFLYQYTINSSTPLVASLFTYLQPLMGVILGYFLLAEPVTAPLVIGGILAVVGSRLAAENKQDQIYPKK